MEIKEKHRKLDLLSRTTPETTFVFNRNIFISFFNELKYLHLLEILSDNDIKILKAEFSQLLQDFEYYSIYGKGKSGSNMWIYLANIDFDSNYTYIKGKDIEWCCIDNIYLMNSLLSSDPAICRLHKQWVESLRKYSTLISISGEMERRIFFQEQRRLFEEL